MDENNDEKIKRTSYDKSGTQFIVQIDVRNHKHLVEMGKLVEKGEAKSLNLYANSMIYYLSKQKLTDGME